MRWSVRIDNHVAGFAREPVVAVDKTPATHEPTADPGAEGDQHEVVAPAAGAELCLGPRSGGGVVHHHNAKVGPGGEFGAERVLDEFWKVGRVVDRAGAVREAGDAESDGLDLAFVVPDHALGHSEQCFEEDRPGARARLAVSVAYLARRRVDEQRPCVGSPDIEAQDHAGEGSARP